MTPNQLTLFSVALARVCHRFDVSCEDLEGPERFYGGKNHPKNVVLPRHLLMEFCRRIGIEGTVIGHLFDKSPSAVSQAHKAFTARLDTEKRVREVWEWLEASI